MDSETVITEIETIINKHNEDHTIAFYLIEDIIQNYRAIQLANIDEQTKQNQNIPIAVPINENLDNFNDFDDFADLDNFDNLTNFNDLVPKKLIKTIKTKNKSQISEKSKPRIVEKKGDIECSCCYELFTESDVSNCSEGHIICKQCIKKYACQLIYENANANINCITLDITNNAPCNGIFDEKTLETILEPRAFNEFKRVKVQNELKEISNAFDDINIKICANCEKGVDIGEFDLKILICTECGKETCLKCNQLAHENKPCFSNGNVRTDKRLEIEDKLTEELLIRCDNCHKMIYKDAGCNKVTCTCGTTMCSICKKNITKEGYGHFKNSKECLLYDTQLKKKVVEKINPQDNETKKLVKSLL